MTTFQVTFQAEVDEQINVGDRLGFTGSGIVHRIDGELIDVTSFKSETGTEVRLGNVTVSLTSTEVDVIQMEQS